MTAYSIAALLAVHTSLEAAAHGDHGSAGLPDKTMNSLCKTIHKLEVNIFDAPCANQADVLDKIKLASLMIGSEGGVHAMEVSMLRKIADDLEELRERELAELLEQPPLRLVA
jgi:hypothetical protein